MPDTLGPYSLNSIITGDARELAKVIPDESIDLVFCDPIYQNIDDYRWLAETAARVLKPDRALLAFCGIGYLPETLQALNGNGLRYRWRLIVRPVYAKEFHGRLCVMTKECLWYEKGHSKLYTSLFDFNFSTRKGKYIINGKNWGKGLDSILRYVNAFTLPNDICIDFFCGMGSIPAACKMLDRRYLAFEICEKTAELARQRVAQTQPPLPLNFCEQQQEMEFKEQIQ